MLVINFWSCFAVSNLLLNFPMLFDFLKAAFVHCTILVPLHRKRETLEHCDDLLCLDSLLLEGCFDDFLSVSVLRNQLWMFFLTSCSSSWSNRISHSHQLSCLHQTLLSDYIPYGCLSWTSSSSTAALFLFEKRRSSIKVSHHAAVDLLPPFLQYCHSACSTLLSELSSYTGDSIYFIFISLISLWPSLTTRWILDSLWVC